MPEPPPSVDPDEERLRQGHLKSLAPRSGPRTRVGVFDAVLATADGDAPATAQLATATAPTAPRRPYAFYRLARALGMRVVPPTTVRGLSLAEIAASLSERDANGLLKTLRVQNDGRVDALFAWRSARSAGAPWEAPRGTPFNPEEGPQATRWESWANSPAPVPGEDPHLLRDYLEMLVLDYLAANVSRQSAMLSGTSAIVLTDNESAFPLRVDQALLDRLLRHLRVAARFPRGLRDALERFDRAAAKRTFNGGAFEEWLLSPRTLVELDERRAALLTLVEARIAERGATSVLSL